MRYEDGLLVLSAGADELYLIEDATAETAGELTAAWQEGRIDAGSLSAATRALFDQLLAAGVVGTESPAEPLRVALRYVGDRRRELERAIAAELERHGVTVVATLEQSGLAVFVRTNGQLMDLYDRTPEWRTRQHLLVDAAYDHTISIGPLVFPGDTACLGCLAGRIGHYWGDGPPPATPAVQRHATLIASLLALELEKIATGDIGLINATVAWDLRGRQIRRNSVYKLPWCPFCGDPEPAEQLGSIDLPWTRGG